MANKKTESKEIAKQDKPITTENGLVLFEGNLPEGVKMEDLQAMIRDDIQRTAEDIVPRLPQIKILHAGAQMFKMPPDEEGNEKNVESFGGVIIDKHRCNAYWEKSFGESGGGMPPDCASLDGKHGMLLGGDTRLCASCKYNRFGTATDDKGQTTRGKACKNMMRLHVWMEGYTLPRRLTLPPSSIKEADTFFSTLIDRGMPMTAVKLHFSLAEAKSGGGIVYSQIRFAVVEQIPIGQYFKIKKFLELHLAQIRGQEILAEEYEADQNGEEKVQEGDLDDLPF